MRVSLTLGVLLVATGCRGGFDLRLAHDANDNPQGPDAAPGYFLIGGTVSGLSGAGLVLQDNGGDALALPSNGAFRFAIALTDGAAYDVAIAASPVGESCSISGASGLVMGEDVEDITVTCYVAGACPSTLTFTSNSTFTLPTGCTTFVVTAEGGGGAGGAKNVGMTAAAGGRGGLAVRTFSGQAAGTSYTIAIGLGGTCGSTVVTAGGYIGGRGGNAGGSGVGGNGDGVASPPGGTGGAGSSGGQPGGGGGTGGFGGGGGGGGGDTAKGNSAGGATRVYRTAPSTDYVVAGGGGGAGAADQDMDVAGAGGNACTGYGGANGGASVAGPRSGGGGGGGGCTCIGGVCDATPTPTGGAGGIAGTAAACTAAQNGAPGKVTLTFP